MPHADNANANAAVTRCSMRIMIVVTHLLGTGHLARALTLGRAFAAAGDAVTVVSGGTVVDHFDTAGVTLRQLPPVRSDGVDFTRLLTPDGHEASANVMATRTADLLAAFAAFRPDVLITELFPFGRRILRHEFTSLLEAAQQMVPRPLVLASLRDILAPPTKPQKAAFAQDIVTRFYDGVLVHADPQVVRLEQSWPVSDALARMVHYTGFVAPKPPIAATAKTGAVLVSTGGGTVGDAVFQAACQAARLMPQVPWMLLVGGSDARRAVLAQGASANVTVAAPRADFRQLLMTATASVSMVGYNTAMDVLQTGVPAVLIPFDDGAEVEQGLRADALSALPGISVLRQDALSGPTLVAAIDRVVKSGRRAPRIHGMDGAAATVEITHRLRNAAP
jgi:predicted glycosyltransferase